MADDEPVFEDAFDTRWGIELDEARRFLDEVVRRIALPRHVDPRDLTNGFLADRVLGRPVPYRTIRNAHALLRTMFRNYVTDVLRRGGRDPVPLGVDVEAWWDAVSGDGFSELVFCFWQIVDDSRFPPECADAISLRLDRATLQHVRTWQQVGDEMSCKRNTAQCHFQRGTDTVVDVLENGWGDLR